MTFSIPSLHCWASRRQRNVVLSARIHVLSLNKDRHGPLTSLCHFFTHAAHAVTSGESTKLAGKVNVPVTRHVSINYTNLSVHTSSDDFLFYYRFGVLQVFDVL